MALTPERINDIVHALNGTSQSLNNVLEDDEDESDAELCAAIDAEIFECARCGWWCEQNEAHESTGGEDVCEDCHEGGD